jgi:hypothetical protein
MALYHRMRLLWFYYQFFEVPVDAMRPVCNEEVAIQTVDQHTMILYY